MVRLATLMKRLKYKPKWVGNDLDGCRFVQFREFRGFSPSLEFGTQLHGGRQYIYFEIIDTNKYRGLEGSIIPINSPLRLRVLHPKEGLTKENVDAVANHINNALGMMYRGKL